VSLKDHILKLVADRNQNRAASLLVCLNKEGRKYQQSVPRFVYYHFAEKFYLADKAVKIHARIIIFTTLIIGIWN